MLEQKLFFTRHGEYTIWEKISMNNKENLYHIKLEIEDIFQIDLGEDERVIINNIYNLYNRESKENKVVIENIIDNNFYRDDKSDFNAILYKFDNSNININTVDNKLNKLSERVDLYDESEFEIDKFTDIESRIVDIRLRSKKLDYYKGSSNEQVLNTEVRIYLNWGLVVMTDFSDYTRKKSIKNNLISDISHIIMGSESKIEECILSDMTLRVLLKQSKNNASKYKFTIDGLMDVDFSIIDGNSENPLYYEHLRGFYEKSKLSAIKISMNSNSEKNITIDGNKAKIRAQSKNLTDSDINEFMGCLNEVMRYDYLNKDYSLEVFEKTKNKLVGTTIQRKNTIEGLYNEVYQAIYKELGDNVDIDIKSILNNSFFYCLLNNVKINYSRNINLELDSKTIKLISKLFAINSETINKLYTDLIYIGKHTEIDILEEIDRYIMDEGVENVG